MRKGFRATPTAHTKARSSYPRFCFPWMGDAASEHPIRDGEFRMFARSRGKHRNPISRKSVEGTGTPSASTHLFGR